ncbi:unnamed protein product [Taenia asiatica]|uniref:DUF4704 domain-containing protein n=1 Tax=Taenia asiatica TaxID=60517 RepID=A0A0R3WCT9_TAEAS|nr:unnamed protein product [Taenia asiatica]
METNSLSELDHNASGTNAVDTDPEQNSHKSNATSATKEGVKPLDDRRLPSSALSDLLNEFLNKGDVPWYMLTIAFVYNRWTKSELRCYVDGKITSSVEMAWPITGSDPFERCVIGGSFEQRDENLFSGRIASITGFTEALSPQQISALYSLGPNYKGQLRFESEVRGLLSETECKALIESKLSASIMFVYHPLACDHNLCLDQSPKPNSVYAHSPHGLMQGKVRSVRTTSLQSSIQSLGGIQLLYLLFEQLDFELENAVDTGESQNDAKPFPIS